MSIKIRGLSKVTADLKKFGVDGTNVVKRELDLSATNIQINASAVAPSHLDKAKTVPLNIKQRIIAKPLNKGLTYQIGIFGSEPMDGWVEFSTGLDFIQVINADPRYKTPEILKLAESFLGKIRPRTGTLIGTPYLMPAFFNESPRLIENLKKELKKLAEKV